MEGLPVTVRTHLNARMPDVSDDPAPQSIIKIEDDALDDFAELRQNQVHHCLGRQRQIFEVAEGLAQVPQSIVEPVSPPDGGRHRLQIAHQYVRFVGCGLGDSRVQRLRCRVKRVLHFEVELSKRTIERQRKIALNDAAIEVRFQRTPDSLDTIEFRFSAVFVVPRAKRLRRVH